VRATIETSRLILRPFESDDVDAAFTWFGNPIVMRFTPTGPDTSIEQTKARVAKYQEHQTAHGFSKWIILDRRLGRPIGDSGLLMLEEYGWIDFGSCCSPYNVVQLLSATCVDGTWEYDGRPGYKCVFSSPC